VSPRRQRGKKTRSSEKQRRNQREFLFFLKKEKN
jgi:hypothetical protein